MKPSMSALFTDHPDSVGESYGEHFGVAMGYSARLARAAFCALMHAFLPFLFEKTASTAIKTMAAEMAARAAGRSAAKPVSLGTESYCI